MGTLYLVRHGQASLGSDNYDQLSPHGHEQAVRLGEYWRSRGMHFDAVVRGSLVRHEQTLNGILQGLQSTTSFDPLVLPALNEYDGEALIQAIHPGPRVVADTPERYKQFFRILCDALAQWMAGTISPRGMPSYPDFVAGVTSALDHVRTHHPGQKVLIVSSGGPIATALGHVLALSPERTIDLNMRIRNSAVTEFQFGAKRHTLLTYNTLPHLDNPDCAGWTTFA